MIKFEDLQLKAGFAATNGVVLHDKGARIIAAFDSEFRGRDYFMIQELYEEYGVWNPGKGISVPLDKKRELMSNLKMLCEGFFKELEEG